MFGALLRGAIAGAAGTTALNTATYVDMALRGRGASSTPQRTVERLADRVGVEVPGEGEEQDNRVSGVGSLLGMTTGIGVGMLYGAARELGWRPPLPAAALTAAGTAMAGSSAPMTALGVTDPRTWSATDWLSDALPHLAYGLTTALAFALMARNSP